MMEAYEAYKIYHALKLHFNSDYDYTKYNGKIHISREKINLSLQKLLESILLQKILRTFLYLILLSIQKVGLVILMKKIILNIVKEIKV